MTAEHAFEAPACAAIELTITARPRDLGGFSVRRTLPTARRRAVGPFVFFDHMGPARFAPGHGIDVRPHPHIGLATVTYLFEGAILHRDSLGSVQKIVPGDVNWMLAGRGIAHSERTAPDDRAAGSPLHGIQSWMALPVAHEEDPPDFEHHDAAALPRLDLDGVSVDVIVGTAFGARAPTATRSPTLYAHARLPAETSLTLDTEHEERAVYVAEGSLVCDGHGLEAGTLAVLRPGQLARLESTSGARTLLIGGAPLDGERHLFWNFVSSSSERLERAKADWAAERWPLVPGDDAERIPLPPG